MPGLAFNRTNVKVGDDGTKLVQIHQSQITPDQLETLQNNPNIKVCFYVYMIKLYYDVSVLCECGVSKYFDQLF